MQIIAQVWRLGFRNNATKALSSISHGWKVFQPPERRVTLGSKRPLCFGEPTMSPAQLQFRRFIRSALA